MQAIIGGESQHVLGADMTRHSVLLGSACLGLTLLSGIGDAYGFVHAASAWRSGRLVPAQLARSAGGFAVGIVTYWLVVRYLEMLGVHSATLQTIGWFGVTLIGVAVVSGDLVRGGLLNQLIAAAVVVGIGWLLVSGGTN